MRLEDYINEIQKLSAIIGKDVKLMEVCGTHTQVIAQYGIKNILPKNIKLFSGPGCPVCVASKNDIDAIVAISLSGVPIASYGDMIRVKGSNSSLEDARRNGADVKVVYNIEELFKLDKKTIFFGIGFETTTPMTASAIKRGLKVYSAHKAFIPAMKFLLSQGEINVSGLISPGHVAAIVGSRVFRGLKNSKGEDIPQVITGFELEDVLAGIIMLLKQINECDPRTENEYKRVVKPEGNLKALKLINEVFCTEKSNWRGLGEIPESGFSLREEFKDFDAKVIYKDIIENTPLNPPLLRGENKCICSDVIKGNAESKDCPMFRKICSPDNPQGPCMVSVEGACHINYKNRVL